MVLLSALIAASVLVATPVAGQRLVLSNDDGWAVANIRAFNSALKLAGFDVVLSAPADNESGTGSSDAPPTPRTSACEFNSCPAGSPATGSNASDTHLNYVNSFPATSTRYGIQTLAPKYFDGAAPELVVAGPNVGSNLGSTVMISGTVGAATEAALEGFPAIAFSGSSGSQVSYTTLSTSSSSTTAANVYAALSTNVTRTLANSAAPLLPPKIALNVNFPSTSGSCNTPSAFKFVLTRINSDSGATDVNTCGSNHLPTESSVVQGSGCLASISVFNATNKGDVDAATQGIVLQKLQKILSCK